MQARGQTVAHIQFDAAKTAMLRREQVEHLAYHIARLLTGERTAATEWEHLGLTVHLEDAD